MYSYPGFIKAWFIASTTGNLLNIFHWLWFLPLLFLTDILNFMACRWMLFFFEGGWYTKEDAPGVHDTPSSKTLEQWVHLKVTTTRVIKCFSGESS